MNKSAHAKLNHVKAILNKSFDTYIANDIHSAHYFYQKAHFVYLDNRRSIGAIWNGDFADIVSYLIRGTDINAQGLLTCYEEDMETIETSIEAITTQACDKIQFDIAHNREVWSVHTKTFYCVTTMFYDNGHVTSNLTAKLPASKKPKDEYFQTETCDVYHEWFDSIEKANAHIQEARNA